MNLNRCLNCGEYLIDSPEHHVRCKPCWTALWNAWKEIERGERNPFAEVARLEERVAELDGQLYHTVHDESTLRLHRTASMPPPRHCRTPC